MALAVLVALGLWLGAGTVTAHPTTRLLDTHADAHAGAARTVGHLERPAFGLPTGGLLWVGLIAGAGLLRRVACRPRGRAIALGLSLALAVFTVEAAVHSVHHLADPEAAATCPVFSGFEHFAWGETEVVATDAPPPAVTPAPLSTSEDATTSAIYRPHQGRAPPA